MEFEIKNAILFMLAFPKMKHLGINLTKYIQGTSLVVQWLRLCASIAGGMGLIPGWGTKILHATQCSQKQKKKNLNKIYIYTRSI